jgi:hypothetical protein
LRKVENSHASSGLVNGNIRLISLTFLEYLPRQDSEYRRESPGCDDIFDGILQVKEEIGFKDSYMVIA